MKDLLKDSFSLVIAGVILLGILFLPPDTFEKAFGLLSFLSKGHQTAPAFGNYLIQKAISTGLVIFLTVILTLAARRLYRSTKKF